MYALWTKFTVALLLEFSTKQSLTRVCSPLLQIAEHGLVVVHGPKAGQGSVLQLPFWNISTEDAREPVAETIHYC